MRLTEVQGNLTKEQVQVPTATLQFVLEKGKGYDTPAAFFGYGTNLVDRIDLNLQGSQGSVNICPNQEVFPIAMFGTVGPNNMEFTKDAQGKLNKCKFIIEIGFNGAIPFNQYMFLSINTNFSDIKNMRVYATPSRISRTICNYQTKRYFANAGSYLPLANVRQFALPPAVNLLEYINPLDPDLKTEDRMNLQFVRDEINNESRSANDIAITIIDPILVDLGGEKIPNGGKVVDFYQGGSFYNIMSGTPNSTFYGDANIVSPVDMDLVYQRVMPISSINV